MALESADKAADGTGGTIVLTGPITVANLQESRAFLEQGARPSALDLSGVTRLDTAGAWLIASFLADLAGRGGAVAVTGASGAQALLLRTVTEALPAPTPPRRRRPHHRAGDAARAVR